jgi:hypothetical protein
MKSTSELLAEIISRAESGEHSKFNYITSWRVYKTKTLSRKATQLLIHSLDRSANTLFKRYCKAVKGGNGNVMDLLVRNALLRTKKFYEKELAILEDMISEYNAFLIDGNLISQLLLSEIRPISECWDRRDFGNGF